MHKKFSTVFRLDTILRIICSLSDCTSCCSPPGAYKLFLLAFLTRCLKSCDRDIFTENNESVVSRCFIARCVESGIK